MTASRRPYDFSSNLFTADEDTDLEGIGRVDSLSHTAPFSTTAIATLGSSADYHLAKGGSLTVLRRRHLYMGYCRNYAVMVKSTVRFSDTVMDRVEELIEGETFSSKSEFQRFAVEFVLSEIDDYEPEMLDFEDVRDDVFPDDSPVRGDKAVPEPGAEFYQIAARVRQFAIRGEIETARDLIDTHYPATDPRSLLLDDIVETYRTPDQLQAQPQE